jgi:hypothetical protein
MLSIDLKEKNGNGRTVRCCFRGCSREEAVNSALSGGLVSLPPIELIEQGYEFPPSWELFAVIKCTTGAVFITEDWSCRVHGYDDGCKTIYTGCYVQSIRRDTGGSELRWISIER